MPKVDFDKIKAYGAALDALVASHLGDPRAPGRWKNGTGQKLNSLRKALQGYRLEKATRIALSIGVPREHIEAIHTLLS